jgi:hypothetical protein
MAAPVDKRASRETLLIWMARAAKAWRTTGCPVNELAQRLDPSEATVVELLEAHGATCGSVTDLALIGTLEPRWSWLPAACDAERRGVGRPLDPEL